jgi:hypothetical protein
LYKQKSKGYGFNNRLSSNDTIAIALGGKLKGIKVKNSWVTLYLSQDDLCKIQYTLEKL